MAKSDLQLKLCSALPPHVDLNPSSVQGKLGVPGLPGYPGRQGPKVGKGTWHGVWQIVFSLHWIIERCCFFVSLLVCKCVWILNTDGSEGRVGGCIFLASFAREWKMNVSEGCAVNFWWFILQPLSKAAVWQLGMLKAPRSKSRWDFNSPLAPDMRTIEHNLLLRLIHLGCLTEWTAAALFQVRLFIHWSFFLLVRTGISGFPRIPWRQRREGNPGKFPKLLLSTAYC